MRLHSVANIVYEPENVSELIEIINDLKEKNIFYYILSAGSNIVFGDKILHPIIYLMSVNKDIVYEGDNIIYCGASVRIQNLLSAMKNFSLGGLEYLASVPSSIGGAIYMNAGRGKKYGLAISDYIVSVDYLDYFDMQVKTLYGNSKFSYRKSPFQQNNGIILGARLKFITQTSEVTTKLIRDRLVYSKKYLSADKPSCGSVFNEVNPFVIRLFMGYKKGGAMFSNKTPNWINNIGNATAEDVLFLINKIVKIHKLLHLKFNLEIRCYK